MTNQTLEEIVKRYDSEEGSVRKFLKEFPLFSEAFQNQDLEKTDIVLRDELQKKLSGFQPLFRKLEEGFVAKVDLANIGKTNPIVLILDRIINTIRASGIGSFGFGAGTKASREEITKIVEYDFSLLAKASLLETEINAEISSAEPANIPTSLQKMTKSLEQFEKDFLSRTSILKI